jgi:hypothetical protein
MQETIVMWFLGGLLILGITIILYSSTEVMTIRIYNQLWRKICRVIITAIIVAIGFGIYWHYNHSGKVQMKEDILYVKPKAKHS